MGFFDWLFGDEDTSAQDATLSQNAEVMKIIRENAERARGDVMDIMPTTDINRNLGLAAALDTLARSGPEQMRMAQEGNMAAQSALLSALPQVQNAILGNPIDMSGLRPTRIGYDPTVMRAQLPQFQTPDYAAISARLTPTQQAEIDRQNAAADRDNAITNFISGNFNGSPSGSANETDTAPDFGPSVGSLSDLAAIGLAAAIGPQVSLAKAIFGPADIDPNNPLAGIDAPNPSFGGVGDFGGDGFGGPSSGMNDPSEQGFGSGAF